MALGHGWTFKIFNETTVSQRQRFVLSAARSRLSRLVRFVGDIAQQSSRFFNHNADRS